MDIAGAVALVTGAGSGIGRATALRLAGDGAAVAVADIDAPRARDTARLIEDAGGRAMPIRADVAYEGDVRAMIDRTREHFGRLDILVNNAGSVEGVTTRAELSPQEWQAIAPSAMTQPGEIAEAVVRLIVDETLAGRVMLCVGPKPWPLAELPKCPP